MSEKIKSLLDNLKKILSNLKKSPNRKYQKRFLSYKTNEAFEIHNSIVKLVEFLKEENRAEILFVANETFRKIQDNIKSRQEFLPTFKTIVNSLRIFISLHKITITKMAVQARIDLNLAIKIIDRYDGEPTKLPNFIENIDLLISHSVNVPVNDIINFIKTRLIGTAHGAINDAVTIDEVKTKLRQKFSVKLTPRAIQNEMNAMKQGKKTISEYGDQIAELTVKLAAAHVSQGTFQDEASADAIVQPIAVHAFTTGLRDKQSSFFVTARNPQTLSRAISDALEVTSTSESTENVFWMNNKYQRNRTYNQSSANFRYNGNYRRYHDNQRDQNYQRGQVDYRGRGNSRRGQSRGWRGRNNSLNQPNNERNRGNVNVAETSAAQPNQQPTQQVNNQEVNHIDLFRQ